MKSPDETLNQPPGTLNSPVETLQECRRRGIVLSPDAGKLTFTAPPGAMTPDLLSAVKRYKAGILEHLSAPEYIRRQRWGITPDCEIPLTRHPLTLRESDAALLVDHFTHQSEAVREWALRQAERYAATFPEWPKPTRGNAALLDVLLWQWERSLDLPATAPRFTRTRAALKGLRSLRVESEHLNAKEARR